MYKFVLGIERGKKNSAGKNFACEKLYINCATI